MDRQAGWFSHSVVCESVCARDETGLAFLSATIGSGRLVIECIFTIDYEVYGNGEGSLRELVFEPTQRLVALFHQERARFVTFVEAAELDRIEEDKADEAIGAVRAQILQLHREGFEIALHLHPQWYRGRCVDGTWQLDKSEYNLCVLPRERIVEIVDRALAYLRSVLNEPDFVPLAFRAGNWLFQPTETAGRVLRERGIKIDSSVFKGGLQHGMQLDYRRALRNGDYWRFSCDVNEPDVQGDWIEIPVYTEMVPAWRMVTPKRVAFKDHLRYGRKRVADRMNRVLDLMRLKYPLKLDFCRMTFAELTSMVDKLMREDAKVPHRYRPIVAIGHTKDLVDLETVRSFLSFLRERRIAVATFADAYPKVLGQIGRP